MGLLEPVVGRVLTYVLSAFIAMIPVSYAGGITFDPVTWDLVVHFKSLLASVFLGLGSSVAILKKWGTW